MLWLKRNPELKYRNSTVGLTYWKSEFRRPIRLFENGLSRYWVGLGWVASAWTRLRMRNGEWWFLRFGWALPGLLARCRGRENFLTRGGRKIKSFPSHKEMVPREHTKKSGRGESSLHPKCNRVFRRPVSTRSVEISTARCTHANSRYIYIYFIIQLSSFYINIDNQTVDITLSWFMAWPLVVWFGFLLFFHPSYNYWSDMSAWDRVIF